jgi:hypothetical protein
MSNCLNTKGTKGTKKIHPRISRIAQLKKYICRSLVAEACPLITVKPFFVPAMLFVGNF